MCPGGLIIIIIENNNNNPSFRNLGQIDVTELLRMCSEGFLSSENIGEGTPSPAVLPRDEEDEDGQGQGKHSPPSISSSSSSSSSSSVPPTATMSSTSTFDEVPDGSSESLLVPPGISPAPPPRRAIPPGTCLIDDP